MGTNIHDHERMSVDELEFTENVRLLRTESSIVYLPFLHAQRSCVRGPRAR